MKDKQIIYYYRNGFRIKDIAQKTGLTVDQVKWRLKVIKSKQKLVRWYEEDT